MEGESNRRGFRNRENERGRRESKDNNFNCKEKKITLMGYYNPSVVQFYSLWVICLAAVWWVGLMVTFSKGVMSQAVSPR